MPQLAAAIAIALCLIPCTSFAGELNLATLSCAKYENEVLPASASSQTADPINTVMWLFGYAVAKSGAHVMYGDALKAFGFGLDAECKENPNESVLDALGAVKPDSKNPMDLATLQCATFESRHENLARSDQESANTIMMWLLGFAVAKSGSHIFDAETLGVFGPALLAECKKHPEHSLFDAVTAPGIVKPGGGRK